MSDYIDPASEPVWENEPTQSGYGWFCNACPFETVPAQEMLDHLIKWRDRGMTHMGFERTRREDPARRRMAVYHGGLIQAQVIPRRATRAAKTKS